MSEDISVHYFRSGHIIGACSIQLTIEGTVFVFSGDIGRSNDELMYPPQKPTKADYVFLESTYGDRLHPATIAKDELARIINESVSKGGKVVIPSFAVERAQTVMYLLWQLKLENRIPDVPYIIDTPMGVKVMDVFIDNTPWHKLTVHECDAMTQMFQIVSTIEDTFVTIFDPKPKVVIAASGMVTGGRVLEYLEYYIDNPQNNVVLVGYQAEGTRGRKLLDGATEIKFYGKYHPVRAHIHLIDGMSAHGDQHDLVDWLSDLQSKPQKIFLVHGENMPADELRIKINEKYGYDCMLPTLGQVIDLDD